MAVHCRRSLKGAARKYAVGVCCALVVCCSLAGSATAAPANVSVADRRAAIEKELAEVNGAMTKHSAALQNAREKTRNLHAELYERRSRVLEDVPRAGQIETQIRQLEKELDALRAELAHLKKNHPDVKKLQDAEQKSRTETREAGRALGRLVARKKALARELATLPAAPVAPVRSPTDGVK